MDKLDNFIEKMENPGPEDWEDIPDIDLYMDQVISYMKRQHIGLSFEDEEALTPAMINNYSKNKLLPRAKGKRYDRTHIAYLTAICLLKQVLTVNETGFLLQEKIKDDKVEEFYEEYKNLVKETFGNVAEEIQGGNSKEDLVNMALEMAVKSYSEMLACKKILQALKEEENTK